MVFFKKILL